MSKIIQQWSHSRLKVFEQCRYRAYLQYIEKIPEPERPLPPGKTEHANDRGTRIHLEAELFVRGEGPFPKEMAPFREELEKAQRLYAQGKVSLEGEWAVDPQWTPVDWSSPEAWLRLKIDMLVFLSPYEALVVDYKTGQKFGNEVTHAEQTQLYQLATFDRYPELETITTELWYPDQNDITTTTYTRNQGIRFRKGFDKKGESITTCTEFPPNPSIFTCRYCAYGPWGTGHCTKGVKR